MKPHAALGLVLLFAGCAGASAPPGPLLSTLDIPDLRGTWRGTWGETPVTLVITEQQDSGSPSGVYLGPVQVLGQRVPGVSGVLTSVIAGHRVSASVKGWLTTSGRGTVTLWLEAHTADGTQQLSLTSVPPDRLTGRGESEFRWGPRGAVELIRSSPPVTGSKHGWLAPGSLPVNPGHEKLTVSTGPA